MQCSECERLRLASGKKLLVMNRRQVVDSLELYYDSIGNTATRYPQSNRTFVNHQQGLLTDGRQSPEAEVRGTGNCL